MLKQSSIETRKKFLYFFTNEIIATVKHQKDSEIRAREAQERINQERDVERLSRKYISPKLVKEPIFKSADNQINRPREISEKPRQIIESEEIKKEVLKKPQHKEILHKPVQSNKPRPLPVYKPTPGLFERHETPFDLNKIQVLIEDKEVTSIECQGEDKELIIKKRGQLMKTEIKLKKQDISEVIKQFSEKARIPLIEGLLRARVGDLQISAVVSNVASSRFIITRVVLQLTPSPVIFSKGFQGAPSQFQRHPFPERRQPLMIQQSMSPIQRPFMSQQTSRPLVQQQNKEPMQKQTSMLSKPMLPVKKSQQLPQMQQPGIMPPPMSMPSKQMSSIQQSAQTQQLPQMQQPMQVQEREKPMSKEINRFEGMQLSISSQEPVPAREISFSEKPKKFK